MKLLIFSFVLFFCSSFYSYAQEINNKQSFPDIHSIGEKTNSTELQTRNKKFKCYPRCPEFPSQFDQQDKTDGSVKGLNKELRVNKNLLTGFTNQNWNGSDWENGILYTATYDGNEYSIEEVWQNWNGSQWVNNERETETHDVNGNWLEYLYYTWSGSEWIASDRETQTYNVNGNWTE